MAADKAVISSSQGGNVLSHRHRKDRIHVLTLDSVLSTDVFERLSEDPRLQNCEIIAPHNLPAGCKIETIEALARQTVSSRVLIFDVRSLTLPRIQHAFNKIVGYNRKDINEVVFVVLIGDGPLGLFEPGSRIEVFAATLAKLRVDYSPAAFFYDPFLHYAYAERQSLAWSAYHEPPRQIPERLAYKFKGEELDVNAVRRFFRAVDVKREIRLQARLERRARLEKFFRQRIAEAFPNNQEELAAWFSKEGHQVESEKLRLHLYPMFFEDWVCDLLGKAKGGKLPKEPVPRSQ